MRFLDILLDGEVVFGLNVDSFLQKLLKYCRKNAGNQGRKDKDQSDYYRTGGVVFIGNVNYVRHSRGVEHADRESTILNFPYRLYRQILERSVLVDVIQKLQALIQRVEERYGRY